MQCPKCDYQAADAAFGDPARCPACGVYAHKVRNASAAESIGDKPALGKMGFKLKVWHYSVLALALLGVLSFFGFLHYQEKLLIDEVSSSMRLANSYVSELLDESAKLTNAEYFAKAPRRVQELDGLVARTLAIDDSAIPGTAKAAADYAKGARDFVNAFTEYVSSGIKLSMADSGASVYTEFSASQEGREMIAMSDADVSVLLRASIERSRNAQGFEEGLEQLKSAAELQKLVETRNRYLSARQEVTKAQSDRASAEERLHAAGQRLQVLGNRIQEMTGSPMPIQAWGIPGK